MTTCKQDNSKVDYGEIAQLVERGIEDPSVGGSTPSLPTISLRSLMDRQRISNPSHAGSSPAGEATELIFIKKYYIIYM